MKNIFLKANSEAELIEALPFSRVKNDEGENVWRLSSHAYSLDIVGTIYNDDAVLDDDFEVVTPATAMAGFHANIVCNDDVASKIPPSIIASPKAPKRTWFQLTK